MVTAESPATEAAAEVATPEGRPIRQHALGQRESSSAITRFGVWLSARQVRRQVANFAGKRVGDFGCGYHATIGVALAQSAAHLTLVDVALAPTLTERDNVTTIEGTLPAAAHAIPDGALDVAICTSVLEHLWEPRDLLSELWRVTAPGGVVLVNVPSWRGKRFLEFAGFRVGLSGDEMDDHKTYYDPRDLWPMLVETGFRPRDIRCFRHKFGLNTFAACRKPGNAALPQCAAAHPVA